MRHFTRQTTKVVSAVAVFFMMAWPVAAIAQSDKREASRNVTFISTSDSHYREADRKDNFNDLNRASVDAINAIETEKWPEKLGGDAIGKPRGVVVLGDCIDDGDLARDGRVLSEEQFKLFVADFGLYGGDGRLKFPVFEGWGNHDGPPQGKGKSGFSFQANLKKRNQARKEKGLISHLSDNGLHYSWDWDDVHFVQTNIYPADKQRDGVRYSPVWHDPQGALTFLKKDLAENVGNSGRPVVLLSHCGFDTNWWIEPDWKDAYDAAKAYNVVLFLYGHTGTGLKDWAPPGEKKWTCINDGNLTAGFFVIQITGDRLRAAYRTKRDLKTVRRPDGTVERGWDGTWDWRWLLDRRIDGR